MDVTSYCPFRTGALFWQPRPGTWILTVVCKATFALTPGLAELAEPQEELCEDDLYRDDGATKSLHAPSDMVPVKAKADVLVVGHAFPEGAYPASPLLVRVAIGSVDKSAEIARAHGGAGRSLPEPIQAFGLGPVAPSRPERAGRRGAASPGLASASWRSQPLPSGLDLGWFNSAPADQQLERLKGDEALSLDGLHPQHARLRTRLPGLVPRAVIHRPSGVRTLDAVGDTLWIDTDRAIATLVWRIQAPVQQPLEPGRVVLTLSGPEGERRSQSEPTQHLRAEDIAAPWGLSSPSTDSAVTQQIPAKKLARSDPRSTLPIGHSHRPEGEPQARTGDNAALPFARPGDDSVLPFQKPPAPAVPPPAPPPPAPPPPAPPPLPVVRAFASVPAPPPSASQLTETGPERAGRRRMGESEPQLAADGRSVLALSNAAAGGRENKAFEAQSATPETTFAAAMEPVWQSPTAAPRLRAHAEWKKLLPSRRASDEEEEETPPDPEQPTSRDRKDALTVLRRARALDPEGIESALASSVEDGVFAPPLVIAEGELHVAFDEVETLRATLVVIAPFVAGDKRLAETVEWARGVLTTPGFETAGSAADSVISRVREAFSGAAKALPAGYLDVHVQRILLQKRHYQKRSLWGADWARAMLRFAGGESFPLYLPPEAAEALPQLAVVRARLLAEAHKRPERDCRVGLKCLLLALSDPD